MFKSKKTLSTATFVFLLTVSLAAPTYALSLDQFLHTIANDHPLFKEQSYSEAIQEHKKHATTGGKDIKLNSSLYQTNQEPYQSSPFTPSKIKSTGLSTTLSKEFWETGGSLNIGTNTLKVSRTLPSSSFNLGPTTYYQNELFVSYSQPLLSNLGGIQSKFNTKLEEINSKRVKLSTQKTKEQFLAELTALYFDWILVIQKEKILDNRLKLGVKNVIETQNKYRSKLVDKVDVLRAKTSLKSIEQAKLITLTEKTSVESKIRNMSPTNKVIQLTPNYNIYLLPDLKKYTSEKKKPLFQLRLLDLTKAILEETLSVQEDISKDSLSLNVKGSFLGANTSFSDASSLDRSDQSISLDYTKILGDTTNQETIQKIKLELDQLKETRKKLSLTLNEQLESTYIQIENLKALVKLGSTQVKLANAQTKEERKAYKQGRSQLNFVIQAEDRELNTQLQLLSTAISLQKTVHQYYVLIDKLYNQFEMHTL